MDDGIRIFLLVVLAPLLVGIAMLLIAPCLKSAWAKYLAGFFGACSLLVCAFYLIATGPYMWALHLESKWRRANPQTRSELEAVLAGYTKKDILPAQSGWGQNHQLKPGEKMTRYSLLGAPLDVVLSADDKIIAIYTTYE